MDASTQIQELNARFRIAGAAQVVAGNGGLAKVEIASAAAKADIYLHGGQLTSWQPAGHEEVIFLSRQSFFQPGKAIRGGVPICLPWFGPLAENPKAPQHGFVRAKAWELESVHQADGAVVVELATGNDDAGRQWWPHEFRAVLRATVGAELKLELTMTNTGGSAFRFEEALHTYYRVGDARQVALRGLDGTHYLDKTENYSEKRQSGDITYTQPTDRVYLKTARAVEIADPVLRRRIRTVKTNSHTTVIWNPWEQGAQSLADMAGDEWTQFACVEACNVRAAGVDLAPGESHVMVAKTGVDAD